MTNSGVWLSVCLSCSACWWSPFLVNWSIWFVNNFSLLRCWSSRILFVQIKQWRHSQFGTVGSCSNCKKKNQILRLYIDYVYTIYVTVFPVAFVSKGRISGFPRTPRNPWRFADLLQSTHKSRPLFSSILKSSWSMWICTIKFHFLSSLFEFVFYVTYRSCLLFTGLSYLL